MVLTSLAHQEAVKALEELAPGTRNLLRRAAKEP